MLIRTCCMDMSVHVNTQINTVGLRKSGQESLSVNVFSSLFLPLVKKPVGGEAERSN